MFRAQHAGGGLLRLINCWDAASAAAFASLGVPALATTSAGLCWANGYPDGASLPSEVLIRAVRSIARVIDVPLSVDLEAGYSDDPQAVAELVAALVDAGAVGINLEDASGTPDLLAAKIERVRQRVARDRIDVFVNARTDVYLRSLVVDSKRVDETCTRGRRYRDAGADGLFVPNVTAADDIQRISSSVDLPLNVLASPDLPPPSELAGLGVRRLSSGPALAQVAYGHAAAAAAAFLAEGRMDVLRAGATPYAELNRYFTSKS